MQYCSSILSIITIELNWIIISSIIISSRSSCSCHKSNNTHIPLNFEIIICFLLKCLHKTQQQSMLRELMFRSGTAKRIMKDFKLKCDR